MARRLRLEIPGGIYHVTNRGNQDAAVFLDDQDRQSFLELLGDAATKTGWRIHAHALLNNHFHLVLETPEPNLVAGMKWWLATYTNRFNRRHRRRGHVFAGRYRAIPVAPEGPFYREACAHVLLNPARAGLLPDGEPLASWRWSSLPLCAPDAPPPPAWHPTERLTQAFAADPDDPARGSGLLQHLEALRSAPEPPLWSGLRRGWYFGPPDFGATLLSAAGPRSQIRSHGVVPKDGAVLLGRQIVAAELAVRGWTGKQLRERPRADADKIAIARRLRRETPLPLRWIARELEAGSVHTLRNALASLREGPPPTRSSPPALPSPAPGESLGGGSVASTPAAESATRRPEAFSVAWD